MKKEIKTLSAIILSVSLSAAVFSACDSKTENTETEQTSETTIVHETDYTYHTLPTTKKETTHVYTAPPVPTEKTTKYVHTAPPVPTEKETQKTVETTKGASINNIENTTSKKATNGKVDEIFNGISLITKTSPVASGNAATIVIQGSPNKNYSIEFYKNNSQKADYEGLNTTTSDSSGFVSWTFMIEDDCELGDRKIIIKEKNSDKYIQTFITVQ